MTKDKSDRSGSRQNRREDEQDRGNGQQGDRPGRQQGGGGRQELEVSRRGEGNFPAQRMQDPVMMIDQMMSQMDQLFESFGLGGFGGRGLLPRSFFAPTQRGRGQQQQAPAFWMPQIEVFEREGEIVLRADLPGLRPEDVEVEVEQDQLVIRGERRQEQRQEEQGFFRSERNYGTFFRALTLPEGVDPEQIQARFEHGVLEVHVPVPQQRSQRRRIEIARGQGGEQSGGQGQQGSGRGGETRMSAGETEEQANQQGGAGRGRTMTRGEQR
jgi:HSP20 family protein